MIVLYYDGDCPMCNRLVIWLLKRDKKKSLHFTAIESDIARARLGAEHSTFVDMDTVILETPSRIYTQSTAALKAVAQIPSWSGRSKLLLFIPRPLRDMVYRFIAKNRHRLWSTCPMIPPEYKDRFL